MVRISIASLIYKSIAMADWVYESIVEFTPLIAKGEAEFFFIANDATNEVLDHLDRKKYLFYEQNNTTLNNTELFSMGYGWPEYIHRVYRGYNRAILESKGQIVVLVNSDHFFSTDWLENLLKYFDTQKIITSQLVEPKHSKYVQFPSAINGEFGDKSHNFDKHGFLNFALKIKESGVYEGGAYMPCMFSKDIAIYNNLYPEGNIAGTSFEQIDKTGDVAFFEKLKNNGIKHLTAMDSIVYHLKEGEKSISEQNKLTTKRKIEDINTYIPLPDFDNNDYKIVIEPRKDHDRIVQQLLYGKSEQFNAQKKIGGILRQVLPSPLFAVVSFFWSLILKIYCRIFLRKK